MLNIISIDIGIYHLGMTLAKVNDNWTINSIIDVNLINIQELMEKCCIHSCHLYHEKCLSDYVSHFIEKYKDTFQSADVILVEQQPPNGLIAIQELIRTYFRNKTIDVSPVSLHSHFGIGTLDYESRKVATEKIAYTYLSGFKNYIFQERKHDMADSLCILLFFLYKKHEEYKVNQLHLENQKRYNEVIENLNCFKYKPNEQ